jgi:hypothetical protein
MVTSKEQAREAIQTAITCIAALEHFEAKVDVMNALIDLEWSLREPLVEEEDILDEELHGGVENPWSD